MGGVKSVFRTLVARSVLLVPVCLDYVIGTWLGDAGVG